MKRSSLNRWPYALAFVAGVGGVSSCSSDDLATNMGEDNAVAQQLQSEIDVAVAQNALTASQVRAVRPVLKCVERVGTTNNYKAHFGYVNSSSSSISIPVGFFNRFWPPPISRAQPTTFVAGTQADVVQVPFNGNSLVAWILGVRFDIATRHSRACPVGGGTGGTQGTGGQGTGGRVGTGGVVGTGGQGTGGRVGTGGVVGTGGQGTGGQGTGGQGTGGRVGTGGVVGTGGAGTGGQGTGGQGTGGQGTGGQGTGGQGTGGTTVTCPSTCNDNNPCTIDLCSASTGFLCTNVNAPDNTVCSDGNACTTGDVCLSGACTAGTPRNCSATDQCHTGGMCDPATGACSNPTAPNGASCNDNNACTAGETCQAGACSGGTTTVCSASGQCHVAGTCNPATGVCTDPTAANGTTCSDGNACTTTDVCTGGVCTPGAAKVCTASGVCHVAGTCDALTGACSNPNAANGSTCDDGNLCTTGDSCQSGACAPGAPKVCTATGVCHVAGTCSAATGLCSDAVAPNGASCDDGNTCSTGDACQAGVCTPTATRPPSGCVSQSCLDCTGANCSPSTDGCDAIADPAERLLCENLFACAAAPSHPGATITGPCTSFGDPTACWCGTNPTTCLSTPTGPMAGNGPCLQEVFAAAHTTDPGTIKLRFIDPSFALGRAFNLVSCRGAFCGTSPGTGNGECLIP